MATKGAQKRLAKEYKNLTESPVDLIEAHPEEANILVWHYVITGPPKTPYEGGQYHGILTFPANYPFCPPGIKMITPNGRFLPNVRLCLSISDYHPEQWNPGWTVGTILTGLLSFMTGNENTAGSARSTDAEKRQYAKRSKAANKANPVFVKEFPHLLEDRKKKLPKKIGKEVTTGQVAPSNTAAGIPNSVIPATTINAASVAPSTAPPPLASSPSANNNKELPVYSWAGHKRSINILDELHDKPTQKTKKSKNVEVISLDDDDDISFAKEPTFPAEFQRPDTSTPIEVIDLDDSFNVDDTVEVLPEAVKKNRRAKDEDAVIILD